MTNTHLSTHHHRHYNQCIFSLYTIILLLLLSTATTISTTTGLREVEIGPEMNSLDLERYNIDPDSITVSGISGGGYMAVQFQVAFSSIVQGAGIVAAGPYFCAKGNIAIATTACMSTPSLLCAKELAASTLLFSNMGVIDPIRNLAKQRVFVFSGSKDSVVHPNVVKKLVEYYGYVGISDANIRSNFHIAAEHAMVGDDYGNACEELLEPFLNNCNYSVARAIFESTYGSVKPPAEMVADNLLSFSQDAFGKISGFASKGFVYVPTSCRKGKKCKLHIAFHGCKQGYKHVGDEYVVHAAGYNKYAEANDIIVLYPQAKATNLSPLNPNGCFDWWGYSSLNYYNKAAPQMIAVKKMIESLTGMRIR